MAQAHNPSTPQIGTEPPLGLQRCEPSWNWSCTCERAAGITFVKILKIRSPCASSSKSSKLASRDNPEIDRKHGVSPSLSISRLPTCTNLSASFESHDKIRLIMKHTAYQAPNWLLRNPRAYKIRKWLDDLAFPESRFVQKLSEFPGFWACIHFKRDRASDRALRISDSS